MSRPSSTPHCARSCTHEPPHSVRPRRGPAGCPRPHRLVVQPAKLQHRVARGGADRARGRVTDDDRGQRGGQPAGAGHQAAQQARERAQDRRARPGLVGPAGAAAGQGARRTGGPLAGAGDRRAVPCPRRRRGPRLRRDRSDGRECEDRRAPVRPGAVRRQRARPVGSRWRCPGRTFDDGPQPACRAHCLTRCSRSTPDRAQTHPRRSITVAELFYDDDADLATIQERHVAVLGYGSQGHAHALSLRDSGVDVRVGLPEGSQSRAAAEAEGLSVRTPYDACAEADLIMVLAPDTVQRTLYTEAIEPNLSEGKALFFAHGFNIRFGYITPPANVDVAMVAPKGPGHLVRRQYVDGRGVPCLVAIEQDASGSALALALAYAKGIGGTRAGALRTTFTEETETDLFGEQAVLCGGASALVQAGFETLVEAGYQPEVAYFECLHELKLIVDLMYEGGLDKMRWSISDTAEYGDYSRGPRVVNDATKQEMKRILGEIQDATFAREWIAEHEAGGPQYNKYREEGEKHQIEQVGAQLRGLMSWIQQ